MKDGDTLVRMINTGRQIMTSTRLLYREPTVQINAWIYYDNKRLDPRIIKGNYNFDALTWAADYLEFWQC